MNGKRMFLCRLSICGIAIAALGFPMSAIAQEKTDDQRKAEALERERQRRDDDFQHDSTRRAASQLISKVEGTTELYSTLDKRLDAFSSRMKALLTNDDGKRLAHDPAGFVNYIEIEKYPVATREEIQTKRAAADSILRTLRAEEERVDIGFVPDALTIDEADELYFWVKDRLARLAAQEDRLRTIVTKAPVEFDVAKAKTLADAITDYHARWYELLGTSRILGEELSRPQSEKILVDAARAAELERAEAERERLIREQRAELERMKLEYEVKVLRLEKQQAELRIKAEQEAEDAKVELEALRKDAEVARMARTIDADIARDEKTADAQKKLLVQKCQSTEVKTILAPFTAKGYWQPGAQTATYDKYPISLSRLRATGALEKSDRGLKILASIASNRKDVERPRWPYRIPTAEAWDFSPSQREEVKKAQQYLIELGDTMVEQRMLAP